MISEQTDPFPRMSNSSRSRNLLPGCNIEYEGFMELIVYSAFWCPDCREAKRFLETHEVPYTEIDIESTPGAAEEVIRRTGKRAIPQFVIDGEWVQPYRPGRGFLYDEMERRLGIKSP